MASDKKIDFESILNYDMSSSDINPSQYPVQFLLARSRSSNRLNKVSLPIIYQKDDWFVHPTIGWVAANSPVKGVTKMNPLPFGEYSALDLARFNEEYCLNLARESLKNKNNSQNQFIMELMNFVSRFFGKNNLLGENPEKEIVNFIAERLSENINIQSAFIGYEVSSKYLKNVCICGVHLRSAKKMVDIVAQFLEKDYHLLLSKVVALGGPRKKLSDYMLDMTELASKIAEAISEEENNKIFCSLNEKESPPSVVSDCQEFIIDYQVKDYVNKFKNKIQEAIEFDFLYFKKISEEKGIDISSKKIEDVVSTGTGFPLFYRETNV